MAASSTPSRTSSDPSQDTVRWGLGDAALGYVTALVVSGTIGAIWLAASGANELSLGALAAAQVGLWAGFLGAPVIAAKWRGSGSIRKDFGLTGRGRDALIGVPVGLACQLIVLPLIYLPISLIVDTGALSAPARELTGRTNGVAFGVLALVLVVGAPIVEEIFFRGLLLRGLQRRWGYTGALVGSSAVFGATHFQLLQFVGLAAFGAVLAWLTLRFERLGPAIWAHAAFNATTVVVLFLER